MSFSGKKILTEMFITYPHCVSFLSLMKRVIYLKTVNLIVFQKGEKKGRIKLSKFSSSELEFRKDTSEL